MSITSTPTPSFNNYTNNTIITTNTFVDTTTAFTIAALCSITGASLGLFTCNKHLRNYTAPKKQRNIVRILFIVPIYSIFSWFSLVFYQEALFFNTIRDVYEAYVIYCFLALVLAYGGGENQLCTAIARVPGSIRHPPPFCKLNEIQLGPNFLHNAKRYTLQFVIMKPVFGIFSLIMLGLGQYDQPWYQWVLFFVYNISYTLALYWLVLFYLATKHLPQLKSASPVFKFFAVKIVVFATYYQQIMVQWFLSSLLPLEELNRWNDFILCIEMVLFSCIHMYAFHWSEFQCGNEEDESSMFQSMKDAAQLNDVVDDIRHSFQPAYNNYAHGGGLSGEDDMHSSPTKAPSRLSGDNEALGNVLDGRYEPPNNGMATEVDVVVETEDNAPL